METSVRETQKKYGSRAMIAAIVVAMLFILAGYKPVGKGVVLGAIFSVINFVLIGETLPMRLDKSKRRTFFVSLGSMLFRYVVIAIPLIVAIKKQEFNLFATIFGIFSVQLVILSDHFVSLIVSTRKKQQLK